MDEDLKNASASTMDIPRQPAYSPRVTKPKSKVPKILVFTLIGILLLAGGGYAAWKFVLHKPNIAATVTQTAPPKPQIKTDVPDAPLSQTYKSSNLNVSFKYPNGWKMTEAAGGIRAESPLFTYTGSQGSVAGNFRIYIRQGARDTDRAYIGRGYAIKPSEKLTYTQPAVGQRTDTLISSFGIDTSDNFGFFLIAGNFQLKKDDTLGPNYGKEPETYIIAGGYGSPDAIDDLSFTPVALTYYNTTNAYRQAVAILSTLQLQ